MLITREMNLDQLSERMGGEPSHDEVVRFRALLVEAHANEDTSDIPETEWLSLTNEAIRTS